MKEAIRLLELKREVSKEFGANFTDPELIEMRRKRISVIQECIDTLKDSL